jgi:hypothetical protein
LLLFSWRRMSLGDLLRGDCECASVDLGLGIFTNT